ncbi:hypothetical protein BC828DRAFT_408829 [Blastocladiella britannica]|nr:hypothetical protein BC828DRAFT_408829 [Blastocladiella britannica]
MPLWMRKLSERLSEEIAYSAWTTRGDELVPHLGVLTTPALLVSLLEYTECEDVRSGPVGRSLRFEATSSIVYKKFKQAMHAAGLTSRVPELMAVDGLRTADREWVVLDFDRVFVHMFTPEGRAKYDLDSLWGVSEEEAIKDLEALVAENESSDLAYASSSPSQSYRAERKLAKWRAQIYRRP